MPQTSTNEREPNLQDAVRLHQTGALDRAEAIYRRILQHNPQQPDALHLSGVIAYQRGRYREAVGLIGRAIQILPSSAAYHNNLGSAQLELSLTEEALQSFRRAANLDSGYVEAWYNLGNALQKSGRLGESAAAYRHALQLTPENVTAWNNLGAVLQTQNDFIAAMKCYRKVLDLDSGHAIAWHNLGLCLDVQSQLTEAEECFRRALACRRDYADAHNSLGSALRTSGQVNDAKNCFQQALSLEPQHRLAQSNYLLALDYLCDVTPQEIFQHRCDWGDRIAAKIPVSDSHDNLPVLERRLRIGYVSPDMREHAVASFLAPILAQHTEQFEIYCYADVPASDQTTLRLQSLADQWRNIFGATDEQVARMIREDRIDVLVDLAGHTARNRLQVFARKPAPVQVSYLGDATTSGLAAMDYRISDVWADPWFQDEFCREKIVRLPGGFLCFQPHAAAPAVSEPPAKRNGYVTFGSFNSLAKITSEVIRVWAELLLCVADAKLLLKAGPLRDEQIRCRIAEQFRRHGIPQERLELLGQVQDAGAHFSLYGRIDIGLDPFPYAGTTTTCEALWMGVPVVTMWGETHVNRVGVSLLARLGLNELVASNEEQYLRIAQELAADKPRLAKLRSGMRPAMRDSSICDAKGFTQQLETAYRTMWRNWCETATQLCVVKAG